MHVLVVTTVHTPLDARIHRRQIGALLNAGHRVTFAAPLSGYGVTVADLDPRLEVVDLPRAVRWRRTRALVKARRLVARSRPSVDVVMLHDPELLLCLVGLRRADGIVWDVHEDLAGSFGDKDWVPGWFTSVLRSAVRWLEGWAEERVSLILAEAAYRDRFRRDHPVIPNLPPLPPPPRGPVEDRVVYLGRVSRLRGAEELVAVAEGLQGTGIVVDVVGPLDAEVRSLLEGASERGLLRLHGFVRNEEALRLLDGCLAGLSLLHDHPNYRSSLPTKVVEYQAAGVPVVSTPLPPARVLIEEAGSGVLVPFNDAQAVVDTILRLHHDRAWAMRCADAGRRAAEAGWSWEAVTPELLTVLDGVVQSRAYARDTTAP